MKKLVIGIDLGTTYSCAAVLNDAGSIEMAPNKDTGEATTPSVVLIQPKKNIVGHLAKSRIDLMDAHDEGFYTHQTNNKIAAVEEAKRYLAKKDTIYSVDGDDYNPTSISGAILKKIKQDVEESYGQEVDSAVITVPANFNNQQRQETMNAAKMAGLNVDYIINEPTSAALAYTMHSSIDGIYAVYDFGGGTFDCSIVKTKGEEVEVLGSDGVKHLGGKDIDRCLLKIVEEKYQKKTNKTLTRQQFSMNDAEAHKKHLSIRSHDEEEIIIDGEIIMVLKSEFEASISTLISLSLVTFDNALEDAGIEIDNIMDVVLVGGSSRIPVIQDALEEKIGKKPKLFGNPDETVAKGAAIYAALKNKRSLNINQKATIAGLEVKEITNVYLGKPLLNLDGVLINVNLIEKGMRIPCSKKVKSYIGEQVLTDMIQNHRNGVTLNQISESYTLEEDMDLVEVVWEKETMYPPIDHYEVESSGMDYIKKYCEMSTTYSIDANQVFKVSIKHVQSGAILVNETLSMKEGSLGGASNSDNNLNDFSID
jgi:molecular chaperone DnaK